MNTPIKQWPTVTFTGTKGYSAKHYARLAGAPSDPLRVAERINARAIAEVVVNEASTRLSAGENVRDIMAWQADELVRRQAQAWDRLCNSFAAVESVLASAPSTPAMKRLLSQVRKAMKS